MTLNNDLRISDALTSIVLEGVKEIIGQAGLAEIAKKSGIRHITDEERQDGSKMALRYGELSLLQQALENHYGSRGAQGAAFRSGRSAFCYFMKEFRLEGGFSDLDFRLLPPRKRLSSGLERMARILGREVGQPVEVQTEDDAWLWKIEVCPECYGRAAQSGVCYFTAGLLQEFMSWLSGGKFYLVEEIACRAKGDPACIIRIDRKPLD